MRCSSRGLWRPNQSLPETSGLAAVSKVAAVLAADELAAQVELAAA
jgi:hypothetical protein